MRTLLNGITKMLKMGKAKKTTRHASRFCCLLKEIIHSAPENIRERGEEGYVGVALASFPF